MRGNGETKFEIDKECYLILKTGSAVPDLMCIEVGLKDKAATLPTIAKD